MINDPGLLTCDRCGSPDQVGFSPAGVLPGPDWVNRDYSFGDPELDAMFADSDPVVLLCGECLGHVSA